MQAGAHQHGQAEAGRFYYLDILRGLAALAVVLWHWQMFFYQGARLGPFEMTAQPFYGLFQPFYHVGWIAVYLFFSLSGFIFFCLYRRRIGAGEVGAREFAVLRFSRLYPLHLVTLLYVAALQIVFHALYGVFYGYPKNDFYHFVLQLFLVSQWGLQKGDSFNGPIWSVSIEVLLYLLFFIACRLRWVRVWHALGFVIVGAVLMKMGQKEIGGGIFCFFAGGIACILFEKLSAREIFARRRLWLVGLLLALWAVFSWNYAAGGLEKLILLLAHVAGIDSPAVVRLAAGIDDALRPLTMLGFLFPATLVILALLEYHGSRRKPAAAFLGDISYSSYLIHFPLILTAVLVALLCGISRSIFYSPLYFLFFFALLIALSLASYHFLERPAQHWLRRRFHARSVAPLLPRD